MRTIRKNKHKLLDMILHVHGVTVKEIFRRLLQKRLRPQSPRDGSQHVANHSALARWRLVPNWTPRWSQIRSKIRKYGSLYSTVQNKPRPVFGEGPVQRRGSRDCPKGLRARILSSWGTFVPQAPCPTYAAMVHSPKLCFCITTRKKKQRPASQVMILVFFQVSEIVHSDHSTTLLEPTALLAVVP